MRSFAVMTMKGGTGKTTTAVNVAHGLSLSGRRVLLVDCDPQRNVAVTFGVETERGLAQLLLFTAVYWSMQALAGAPSSGMFQKPPCSSAARMNSCGPVARSP